MIRTYKRKSTSLKSCSFYERLCGDPLTECLPITRPIEKKFPNDCCSRDAKQVQCNRWSKDEYSDNGNILQSLNRENFEPQPIKFKYVRRCKSLCSKGSRMHYVERMTQRNALQTDLDNTDCISFQSKLPVVDPNQDIPGQDTVTCSDDSLLGTQYDNSDKSFGPLENPGSLCRDPDSQNRCINIAKKCEAPLVDSVSLDIDRINCLSASVEVSNKEENEMGLDSSNTLTKRDSESDFSSTFIVEKPNLKDLDGSGTDDSSFENLHKRLKTKCIAPLHTYNRRAMKGEFSSRTYADLLAERANYVSCDQILIESARSHTHDDVPEIVDRGIPENVEKENHTHESAPPLEKLTGGISAIGAVESSQENQKERNGFEVMDDFKASEVTTLNNDVETGQQSDAAIKSPCKICDLSKKESLTSTVIDNTFKAVLGNSQKQERAAVASQHFSDEPAKVDLNLAARIECEGVGLVLQSKALQHSVVRNLDASLSAEAQRAYRKEVLETINKGIMRTNGHPNLNTQLSNDSGFISQNSKLLFSVALPNGSTNSNVLQLFPEGSTGPALGTSNSGSARAVSSNNSSALMAQPDSSKGPQEFIQNKMFKPSSCQEMPKLLLGGIQSSTRPQMIDTVAFRPNLPSFTSYWSEEELDNLWVGIRRHGKENWHVMLRDPKLRFSPWRTERDLAEKWITEQSKLLGNSPLPQCQYARPVGIQMPSPFVPPRPGSMTRFLTDPTQLSLSTPYLNDRRIMLPPMPLIAINSALGNGTRLLNRRVRANRRSRRSENSWERFKTRNDFMSSPQFPSAHATNFRNDFIPPYVSATFDHPKHPSNSTQFHDKSDYSVVDISTRNGTHLANSGLIIPSLAIPSAEPCQANPRNLRRPKVLINLDSDASSEGTISDDGK